MSISSAQPTYSITSSDTITIDLSNLSSSTSSDTITLTSGTGLQYSTIGGTGSTITFTGNGIGITAQEIGSIDPSIFSWKSPEEWTDCFPEWNKIKDMCEKYPAFKIAFEKFRHMYELVEDDYEAKKGNKYVP